MLESEKKDATTVQPRVMQIDDILHFVKYRNFICLSDI